MANANDSDSKCRKESAIIRLFLCLITSAFASGLPVTGFAAEKGQLIQSIFLTGSPGPYGFDQWKKDWPGCPFQDGIKEGHASLTKRGETPFLRIDYVSGQIGPEKNGVGWRYPIGQRESVELRYTVIFGKDFDWVKGGKLPGLAGGPDNVSGGRPATGTNGFSARLMWRAEGRAEAYVYHVDQPEQYGDRLSFPKEFRFPTEVPVRVRMRVTMNDPDKKNGKLRVWIKVEDEEEKLFVDRSNMTWRTVPTFGVDSLYFETFYGGNDSSWAPKQKSSAEFGKVQLFQ